jgi:hypothetical protein
MKQEHSSRPISSVLDYVPHVYSVCNARIPSLCSPIGIGGSQESLADYRSKWMGGW